MTVIDNAKQLLATGRTTEAVALLEAELPKGAGGPSVRTLLGYAYFQADRLADAMTSLDQARELFPLDATLQEAWARMRWLSGDTEHFADDFLAVIVARPDDTGALLKCADLLRLAGRTDEAERLLRTGLMRSPGDASIEAWLGIVLDETGQFEEAERLLRHSAMAFPGEPMLKLNVAHVLLRKGRAHEALTVIAEVRQTHPEILPAITYEGMALKAIGDARYGRLFDYERHVQTYDIAAPRGFSSVADFNAALGARLRELQDATMYPLEQSLRGGTQTSHNLALDTDPILRAYFEALDAPIRGYIDALGQDATHPFLSRKRAGYAMTNCWSVLLRPGGFHVNHTHPRGWISSSYYVSLPPSINAATQEGWIKFGEPRWPVSGCGIERAVQPKEGRLVLFPSYMWHGTIPFSSGERLTAPFDIVPA